MKLEFWKQAFVEQLDKSDLLLLCVCLYVLTIVWCVAVCANKPEKDKFVYCAAGEAFLTEFLAIMLLCSFIQTAFIDAMFFIPTAILIYVTSIKFGHTIEFWKKMRVALGRADDKGI